MLARLSHRAAVTMLRSRLGTRTELQRPCHGVFCLSGRSLRGLFRLLAVATREHNARAGGGCSAALNPRQLYPEGGAGSDSALRTHPTPVRLGKVLHDREAEPCAPLGARARGVYPVKPLEHPR